MRFDTVVFPGQGAQRVGMGEDFFKLFPEAQSVYQIAKDVLAFDVLQICLEDEEKLNLTTYTQPCILATEIAMYRAAVAQYDFHPTYFGGHSLGEYTALVAAGVIPLEIALPLVHYRGSLMQNTSSNDVGAMVAIIMDAIDLEKIERICQENYIDIANDNSLQQIVLSGKKENTEKATAELYKLYGEENLRAVPLNVSAAFHSRCMQEIEQPFKERLLQYKPYFDCKNLQQVASNYSGRFYTGSVDELIDALAKQLSSRVKWRDNMMALSLHAKHILELGPNKPLRQFFATLDINISAVINTKNLHKAFEQEQ